MIHRRQFLRGLGLGAAAAALPFVRVLPARAETTPPKRFVAFFTGNGTLPSAWRPTGTATSFEFGTILRPLDAHKSKLLILDGLDMDVSYEGEGSEHQKGIGALLTGRTLAPGSAYASGISVDQFIARHIGTETRIPSLELGVGVRASGSRQRWVYRGSQDPLPPENNPVSVYERLFADLGYAPGDLARLVADRRSVLDAVSQDLSSLRARLGTDHRQSIDAHLESLRDVEMRLGAATTASPACAPIAPAAGLDPLAPANYEAMGQLQMDLLVQALACDLTRVATIFWSSAGQSNEQTFPWIGIDEPHHPLSHSGYRGGADGDKLARINRWYARQFAYLVAKLDAIPEGAGTMLDNTVVFWGSELSTGNDHSRRGMHFVVAGSGGGYFRTGRWLQYAGRSHNDLLVSFCNAMGIETGTFGDPRFCTGPIANLR